MQKLLKNQKNLGITNKTRILVNRYRILKALEHASRKYSNNMDELVLEDTKNTKELRDFFVDLVIHSHANNSISFPDFLQSNELAIQSALFRILKERDELENAIAEITYRELNHLGPDEKVDDEVVNDYASHLRYCISHPEAMRNYKLK